jgi:hypothetical protein
MRRLAAGCVHADREGVDDETADRRRVECARSAAAAVAVVTGADVLGTGHSVRSSRARTSSHWRGAPPHGRRVAGAGAAPGSWPGKSMGPRGARAQFTRAPHRPGCVIIGSCPWSYSLRACMWICSA